MDANCFYCTKNETLENLMIEIGDLSVSTIYLFKEQTHKGRCNVVFKNHTGNLFDLSAEDRHAFMDDIAKVASAINRAFSPDKINYGAYGDKMQHLHMHVVPKYEGGESWGSTFEMNPQKTYLSKEEYEEVIEKIKSFL